MGCGSGILAILASKKGASEVTAIDIDEWSYNNTVENADLNGIENITPFCGDSGLLRAQQFDTILANIQRNILLEDMKEYHKVLKRGGHLVMSGFYLQDLDILTEKASELGLKLVSSEERSNWCAALFVK
jgi:ribosomal protein L11 methyltransferase